MSCNGACGPLSKTEGTYRRRVAGNSADVSEKEDLLMCPAMAPVGRSPRLKAPAGGPGGGGGGKRVADNQR